MADWFIATEGVKVVKDSASLWPQIITAVSSIGGAVVGVSLTHRFTREREERTASSKRDSERLFIATELVFMLERYASGWLYLRWNDLWSLSRNKRLPVWDLSTASGDWRVLLPRLIFKIRSLEADHAALMAHINRYESIDEDPNDVFLYADCYQAAIQAFMLAGKLRREVGLPDSTHLKDKTGTLHELREGRRRLWTTVVRVRRSENEAFESFRALYSPKEEEHGEQ